MMNEHKAILDLYVKWLNSFEIYNKGNWIKAEDFEPSEGWVLNPLNYCVGYYKVIVLEVYYEDDGGSQILTVYMNEANEPWHATQEFDTMLTVWLNEGELVKP